MLFFSAGKGASLALHNYALTADKRVTTIEVKNNILALKSVNNITPKAGATAIATVLPLSQNNQFLHHVFEQELHLQLKLQQK